MLPPPCRTCGYPSDDEACALCAHSAREPTLCAARARGAGRVWEGFRAFGQGFRILLVTPRTKRLLLPPFLLTSAAFTALFLWSWSLVSRALAALDQGLHARLDELPAWVRPWVAWLVETGTLLVSGKLVALLVFALLASLVFLWCFSVVYEAFCGPFLDAVQGRIEARWFGRDPRAVLEAAQPGRGARGWLRRELATWVTSVKASLVALVVLLLFVWLKFVPLVGVPLFAIVAGFATALTLLDIPFSRRGWTLAQRVVFLRTHLPELVALGVASGLVFLVPFLGPLVGVPSASIGGLWLLVRLDKSALRARRGHG